MFVKNFLGLLIVITLVGSACQNKVETHKTASLSGKIENHGPTVLKISDFLGKSAWTDRISVNNGSFNHEISIDQPVIRKLVYGLDSKNIFLEPGGSLTVSFDAQNMDSTLKFDGDLVVENSILDSVSMRLKNVDYGLLLKLSLDSAIVYIDSLESAVEGFFKGLLMREKETSSSFQDYIHAMIQYKYASLKMIAGGRKDEQPEGYYAFIDQLDFEDPGLLNMYDYRGFLYQYLDMKAGQAYKELDSIQKRSKFAHFDEYLKEVRQLKNDEIRAYALYNAMILQLEEYGIDEFDEYYTYFKRINNDPHYAQQLENAIAEKEKLAPGQAAPPFTLVDVDGNDVSLKDFEGQYVYLDFWQTLCPRSGRELPHYLKLRSEYAEKNIAFVSISVDLNENNWRDYVKENKNVSINVRTEGMWDSEVYNAYQVPGLPTFVLIDKEGKIIDPVAPKPSSEEIRQSLDQLLKD